MTLTKEQRERLDRWLPILLDRDLTIAEFHAMQMKVARDTQALLTAYDEAQRDAARYAFMRDRFAGADFEWGEEPHWIVLCIKWAKDWRVYGDLDATVDAAMRAERGKDGK